MIDDIAFSRLRKRHGVLYKAFMKEKIHVLDGDLMKEKLGLSKSDRDLIIQNVNTIISNAANTSWISSLREAVISNVRGPLELLKIAMQCTKLDHFIHVSSFAVQVPVRALLKEQIYKHFDDCEKTYHRILNEAPEQIIDIESKILYKFGNNYNYSKALAEELIQKRAEEIPTTIIRACSLSPALQTPYPGWV